MGFWRSRGKLGKILIVVLIFVALGVVGAVLPDEDEEATSSEQSETEVVTTESEETPDEAEETPATTDESESTSVAFGDGTHRVGKDIQPGTYRAVDAAGCYWARLKDFSGSLDSILANANESGPAVVTIKSTDAGFESNGCGDWTADLTQITASKTSFDEGTYIVGVDIAPGQYASEPESSCYWARLKSFTGDLNAIIANENPTGRAIVEIAASDEGFQSNGCGTWSK